MRLPTGQRVGFFAVADFLGEGGTSEVYLVREGEQSFALKILKEEHRRNTALQTRLINEAVALRTLNVYGVVRFHAEGDFAGRPYYVMEYLPTSLAARLSGPLPPSQILPVIASLAGILAELHKRGFVHRDVKPSNILFAPDGSVRLADFGHAKLSAELSASVPHSTETGAFLGTREYAAPEQLLNAKSVDGRADVYALGTILFESLAGSRPFVNERPEELARLRLTARAPRLHSPSYALSPQLCDLVAVMLERTPDRRPYAQDIVWRIDALQGVETRQVSKARYAMLLLLPTFLSCPFSGHPTAEIRDAQFAPPAMVDTNPQRAKKLFDQFGTALDEGSLDEAVDLLEQTKAISTTDALAAKRLQKEGDLAREQGQHAEARRLYGEARTRFDKLGARRDWAGCAIREADMILHLDEPAAAHELYEKAAKNHSVAQMTPGLARGYEVHLAYFHLGLYFAELRQFDKARELLLLAKDATPTTDPLFWLARTEERLASLPTEAAPMPLVLSAIEHASSALKQSAASRRVQIALLRARFRHAVLSQDQSTMQSVYAELDHMWSSDKRRAIVAHDYLELLMEGVERIPNQKQWRLRTKAIIAELEMRAQWLGDRHIKEWKVRLGA